MSWTDAFKYTKGLAARHGVASADSNAQRVDQGLPFGARIGGVVKLQMSPLIRANANGSLITIPAAPDNLIKAISRVKLNLDGKLHRFYLNLGDDDADQESFLQVFSNPQGEIAELLYCTRLTRIIPETEEEQDAYTGAAGAGLGEKNYSLWKEQLEGIGLEAAVLSMVFGDKESIEYTREAGGSDHDFVEPFKGTEVRVDDVQGEHGLEQEIYFMPYVRAVGDAQEYLLITTEIVKSQNGDAGRRSIHVDFMIGVPVDIERVTVQ